MFRVSGTTEWVSKTSACGKRWVEHFGEIQKKLTLFHETIATSRVVHR